MGSTRVAMARRQACTTAPVTNTVRASPRAGFGVQGAALGACLARPRIAVTLASTYAEWAATRAAPTGAAEVHTRDLVMAQDLRVGAFLVVAPTGAVEVRTRDLVMAQGFRVGATSWSCVTRPRIAVALAPTYAEWAATRAAPTGTVEVRTRDLVMAQGFRVGAIIVVAPTGAVEVGTRDACYGTGSPGRGIPCGCPPRSPLRMRPRQSRRALIQGCRARRTRGDPDAC